MVFVLLFFSCALLVVDCGLGPPFLDMAREISRPSSQQANVAHLSPTKVEQMRADTR